MPAALQILIVEDDEIISNLIGVILEKKGYAVAGKVTTGEEAVMKAAGCLPGSRSHGYQSSRVA